MMITNLMKNKMIALTFKFFCFRKAGEGDYQQVVLTVSRVIPILFRAYPIKDLTVLTKR